MIWVNLFAGMIALMSMILSAGVDWENVGGSLRLLGSSPQLGWDVTLFSMTSAVGLIVLLNTIAYVLSFLPPPFLPLSSS
jgi:hypothetical protein